MLMNLFKIQENPIYVNFLSHRNEIHTNYHEDFELTSTLMSTPVTALALAKSRNSARVKNFPLSLFAGFLGKPPMSCGIELVSCAEITGILIFNVNVSSNI